MKKLFAGLLITVFLSIFNFNLNSKSSNNISLSNYEDSVEEQLENLRAMIMALSGAPELITKINKNLAQIRKNRKEFRCCRIKKQNF